MVIDQVLDVALDVLDMVIDRVLDVSRDRLDLTLDGVREIVSPVLRRGRSGREHRSPRGRRTPVRRCVSLIQS